MMQSNFPSPAEPSQQSPDSAQKRLVLRHFFPYRLVVLAEEVSRSIAQIYADRFDLTRAEWRVLAALAEHREMTASEVGDYSTLDKMQVSRAVALLLDKGYIRREEDASDRRTKVLSLTAGGRALYQKIVPMALAREEYLLDTLDSDERQVLERALEKLLAGARDLQRRG